MQNILIGTLRSLNTKHRLRQIQANVKIPQLPLIEIGEISIPNSLESQGLLCLGASRDRSKTSINIVRQLKQRTDFRGIVIDRNGELLKRFYDPALDLIFNPLDERSVAWVHKAEAVSGRKLASSLIDIDPVSDVFFSQIAIEICAEIFDSSATNDEVWQKLNVLMPQDIPRYLPDNDIASTLLYEPGIAPTIMRMIKNATQFYRYLTNESDFSFAQWVSNDDPGWIFVPWSDENEDDIQSTPLRQMAINLVLQGLLEQKGIYHHKSAVIMPELPYFKLSNLPKFVGECCQGLSRKLLFIGSENIGSLVKEQGQQNAQVFLEGMPTKLFLNGWSQGQCDRTYSPTPIANESPLSAIKRNVPLGQGYLAIDDQCAKVKILDENEADSN